MKKTPIKLARYLNIEKGGPFWRKAGPDWSRAERESLIKLSRELEKYNLVALKREVWGEMGAA